MLALPRAIWRRLGRSYRVLSIETSCDDTCVAVLDRSARDRAPTVVCHYRETLDSASDGGVVPTKAHEHHQRRIGGLVGRALETGPVDLICATRGPGMPGSLSAGLTFGKALSVGLCRPLVGVHHMVGHLLVPRLASNGRQPQFPFLSLLVSGGHTMLVLSRSAVEHEVLCNTIDVAVGDALDKCARVLGLRGNMIAREMERFIDEDQEGARRRELLPLVLPTPLANKAKRRDVQAFSFCPFITAVNTGLERHGAPLSEDERRVAAFQIQEAIFDHLIAKINLVLRLNADKVAAVQQFVCSGGVCANRRLRARLESELFRPFESFHYPAPELCTDNAVMIGWAGIELHEGHDLTTDVSALTIAKWPIDELLAVPGWVSARPAGE
ncbi:AaceriAFL197Cp [[Ashbya] aceris (nom. inval.)]|nr:AaceriAFL197Cp [[Ashbya] aceris (nom. inval.)]